MQDLTSDPSVLDYEKIIDKILTNHFTCRYPFIGNFVPLWVKEVYVNGFVCLKGDEQTSTMKKGVASPSVVSEGLVGKINKTVREDRRFTISELIMTS
ncbi:hypothetical protein J6590_069610 [Homalodisca vitripennis]|nr:hypothetical protein J6590_069610 [Homalodisca vitripennis]